MLGQLQWCASFYCHTDLLKAAPAPPGPLASGREKGGVTQWVGRLRRGIGTLPHQEKGDLLQREAQEGLSGAKRLPEEEEPAANMLHVSAALETAAFQVQGSPKMIKIFHLSPYTKSYGAVHCCAICYTPKSEMTHRPNN